MSSKLTCLGLVVMSLLAIRPPLTAQNSVFTYQGLLNESGTAASGTFDFRFSLHDSASGGSQSGGLITHTGVAVSNGLFAVALDFGAGVFNGSERWLEMGVRTNGAVAFTTLAPRQRLTAAPYSITAGNLAGVLAGGALAGTYSNPLTFNNTGNAFSGNGSGLTSLNAANLSSGTMSDSRLSANVALRSGGNAFSGNQTVSAGSLGVGTATPALPLHVATGTDASPTGGGYMLLGPTNGFNLVLDNNEVLARSNGATAILLLNNDGGVVAIGGPVGIGTQNPAADLHIRSASTNGSLIISPGASDSQSQIFLAENSSATIGFILRNEGNVSSNPLNFIPVSSGGVEGAPLLSLVRNSRRVGIGTNAPVSELHVNGTATMNVCQIVGGSDLAEPMVSSSGDLPAGSLVVIDDLNPGRVKLSSRAYDSRVAGIISGANGVNPGLTLRQQGILEGGELVALSGRVYALADARTSPIKPGDLLTTADTPGHAMKVADPDRARGAIIGKAMSSLAAGTGMVLVLVSLQ